jgi:hypothetical protein
MAGRHLLRQHACFIVFLLLAAPLYLAWTWSDGIGQLGGDCGSYLMMAEHYSPHGGASLAHLEAATYTSRFPPLYPMLLAWTGGAASLLAAHQVTTLCLLLALVPLYAWGLAAGLDRRTALLPPLLLLVLPGTWTLALTIESEFLYLGLSLLALWLMALYRAGGGRELLFCAALAVSAALLARSIGFTLLPALLLAGWRARRRELLPALLLALLPALAWGLLHQVRTSYTEVLARSYGGGQLWSAVRAQLATELPALWGGFRDNFTFPGNLALGSLAAFVGVSSLVAALWRLRRLEPDAVYALGNLGVLGLWPYPEEAWRFLWVLLPIFFVQILLLGRSLRRPKVLAPLVAAAVLAMALPQVAEAAQRRLAARASDIPGAGTFIDWYGQDADLSANTVGAQVSIIGAIQSLEQALPADDCVISVRPDLIGYFGRVRSVSAPRNTVPEPYFTELLHRSGCHYVFVLNSATAFDPALHPMQRLGGGEMVYRSDWNYHGTPYLTAALLKISY